MRGLSEKEHFVTSTLDLPKTVPDMSQRMVSFLMRLAAPFSCLLWLSQAAKQQQQQQLLTTADDFLVSGLEQVEPAFGEFEGDMYAGLISINRQNDSINSRNSNASINHKDDDEDDGKLMFWLFDPDHPTVDDALVIWFNGGPGCSSLDAGLFFETGPVTVPLQPAGSFGEPANPPFGYNPYAWTNATAIMYMEQPVGTGFSVLGAAEADPPEDEAGVAADFYNFLLNFYDLFPHYRSKRLYLVGESYAGYYVPSMAHKIYTENNKKDEATTTTRKQKRQHVINLAGIALGNGWADVFLQGPAVIDYAYWHGMIDSVTRDAFYAEWQHCQLQTGSEPKPFHPMTTPDECGIMENVLRAAGAGLLEGNVAPNTYDVTTWDPYLVLTDDMHSSITKFFNDPRVREALHIPKDYDKPWVGCIPGAGRRRRRRRRRLSTDHHRDDDDAPTNAPLPGELLLAHDRPESMAPYIAELLDDEAGNIQVLLYNGDRDLSTCAQGSEEMLNRMDWSGAHDWITPSAYSRALWMVDGQVAGYSKSVQKLEFVIVMNSGHLVPYNQPAVALDLVTRLVSDKPFGDIEIPVVFNASALNKPQQGSANLRRHGIVPIILSFLVGAATSFAILKHCGRKAGYELVGNE